MGNSSATVWHVCDSNDEVVTHAKTLLGCRRAVADALEVPVKNIVLTRDRDADPTDDWTVRSNVDGPPTLTGYTLIHRTNLTQGNPT